MKEIDCFGPHLTLDLDQCDFDTLINFEKLYELLKGFPGQIGMNLISEPQILKYKDKWASTPGVTGIVLLAESHMSLHTFPDSHTVFIDIFSCRNFDTGTAARFLIDFFGSRSPKINVVKRGIEFNKHARPVIVH